MERNRMQYVLVVVTGLILAQFASPQAQPAAQERFFKVPANTAVRGRTNNEISSETAHVGDDVQMEVLGDVAVNGFVVIRHGASAIAQISSAKEARNFGSVRETGPSSVLLDSSAAHA
jgi:hypothetical protein